MPRVTGALTAGLRERFSDGQLEHVSAVMPAALRDELGMDVPGADGQQGAPGQPRLDRIEQQVAVLTDAVTKLVRGLESLPTDEPAEGRTARAAQEAHRILLSAAVEA